MRRKTRAKRIVEEQVVDPRVIESAKQAVFEPVPPKTFACRVCRSEGATKQSDGLCWVCRRLKISAWRDIEQHMPLTE